MNFIRLWLAAVVLATCLCAGAADREWTTYNPGNNAFAIKFPAHPEYQTQTADTTIVHVYIARDLTLTPPTTYALSFSELPKEKVSAEKAAVEKILDSERSNFIKGVNGKLISEKPTALETVPGREILVSGEDGKSRYVVREYVSGARIIHLVAWAPGARAETLAADAGKFFDSFQISGK